MKNIILEKEIKTRYSEMDYDLTLKPSALLHFLEDIASESAESLDFGYTFVRNNNLAWFLLKYRMEFIDYPKNIFDLKIKTEPRGCNKLFAFRDFELYSAEKLLGRIASTWSVVDLNSRNLSSPMKVLENNPYMPAFQKRDDDLIYNKIKPLEKIDNEKVFEIRYDDIDVNGHANNSNYIIWAFETLSFDFKSAKKLKSLDMTFKKEIKYGSKVVSQVEIEGDQTNHLLKSQDTNEDLCLICANWRNK